MKRREFIQGSSMALATSSLSSQSLLSASANPDRTWTNEEIRSQFKRTHKEIYLNAAGMMPLSQFSQQGLTNYSNFQALGYEHGGGKYVTKMQQEIRPLFANLINADESEIGLIQCTKAGEQIALAAVDNIKPGGNIVTNDLHFNGSLHNLIGLKQQGRDVRIVKARDWQIQLEDMEAAIDDNTALVCITLVSNVNGHIEQISEITKVAHQKGALVYADIIQAAGIVPIDVEKMGIDIAACSCYKWLYGVHGTAFLYVKKEHQGTTIKDRIFPGHARHQYQPWEEKETEETPDISFKARQDASRYQPGHISYLGFCAAYEGLKFITTIGVETALAHSVKLNQLLVSELDRKKFKCISPHLTRSPVVTFKTSASIDVKQRLRNAGITAWFGQNRLRVSPGVYNNVEDIQKLVKVLNN